MDTTANPWVPSVVHFSSDRSGQAAFLSNRANDVPMADVNRQMHMVRVEMAGIGYDYTMEELEQAMLIPGRMLTADKADAARRAAEEYIDDLVLNGSTDHGWDGLLNNSNVTAANAAQGAAGANAAAQRLWSNKTGQEIISDVESIISGIWTGSRTVEMADTLLVPPDAWSILSTLPRSDRSDMTLMAWLQRYNPYTAMTNQELMINVCRGLENAGPSNVGRMIAYKRDPSVLKLHLPMPFQFLPVQQQGLRFVVNGIFRLGGLEIRRPGAMRYLDGITT